MLSACRISRFQHTVLPRLSVHLQSRLSPVRIFLTTVHSPRLSAVPSSRFSTYAHSPSLASASLRSMSSGSTAGKGSSASPGSDAEQVYNTYGAGDQQQGSKPAPVTEKGSTHPLLSRADPSNSIFFVCDLQETFRDKLQRWPLLLSASVFLTRVAHQLSIPVVVTEQKPFKPTIAELTLDTVAHSLHSKTLFSMLTPAVRAELRAQHPARRHVFVYGLEAHVCVMQTTLDLLRDGFTVHLPLDAVSSMWAVDREAAVERYRGLQHSGLACILTSAESAMFELMADASKADFKKLVPLVKEFAAVKKKLEEGAAGASDSATSSKL